MTDRRRLAAFGFRSVPPKPGCAGADKFAEELYSRLADRGCDVTGYNRSHPGEDRSTFRYRGVTYVNLRTFRRSGAEALWHSLKSTIHIIWHNTGDVVHIQNGGNSIFALPLRLFGKKVFIGEDGAEWERPKWPWYGRLFLRASRWLTAHVPNGVIFDNIFVQKAFEERFSKSYNFVPFGSDPVDDQTDSQILYDLGLESGGYFLFVGRFIPEKGIQYLISAFEALDTTLKLVLVGGSAHGSEFERKLRSTSDKRIIFAGFLYGSDVHTLMRNAYAYVQPSDLEGLSPVILENMGLGTPVICSDIKENIFVVGNTAVTFRQGDINDLFEKLSHSIDNPSDLMDKALAAKTRAQEKFSWEFVVREHERIFFGSSNSESG